MIIPAAFLSFFFIFSQGVLAQDEEAADPNSPEGRVASLEQELNKNKDLLGIWKDHVKTLTQERDTAYKEIEELRTQGFQVAPSGSSQQGTDKTITDLRAQVAALQSQNQSGQLSLLQKELTETKNDKQIIIQDKEKALKEIEDLKAQNKKIQAEADKLKTAPPVAPVAAVSTASQEQLLKEKALTQKTIQDLNTQITVLKQENDKLRIVETQTRQGAAAQDQLLKEKTLTQKTIQDLNAQITSLKQENDKLKVASPAKPVASAASANQDQLLKEKAQAQKTIQDLNSQVTTLKADKESVVKAMEALKAEKAAVQTKAAAPVPAATASDEVLQRKVQALEDANRMQQSQYKSVLKQKNDATKRVTELDEKVRVLENDKDRLLTAAATQGKPSAGGLEAALKDKADAQRAAEDLKAQVALLKTQNDSLNETVTALKSKSAPDTQKTSAEIGNLKSQVKALEAENQKAKAALLEAEKSKIAQQSIVGAKEEAAKQVSALTSDITKLRSDNESLKAQTKTLEAENQKAKAALLEAEKSKTAQLATVGAKEEAAKQVSALTSDVTKLRSDNESLNAQITSLQAQADKAKLTQAELEKTKQDKEAMLQGNTQTQKTIEDLRAQISTLQNTSVLESQKMTQENQALKSQVSALGAAHLLNDNTGVLRSAQ